MARLDGDTLWFADRPGNRRVDSFRNIIDRPQVALARASLSVPNVTGLLKKGLVDKDYKDNLY